ncbi:hypothetical protein KKF32_03065 [Patescibacteria group bacterium]|nr:hypothetical protein [Patescibacteria group bacterium]
MLQNLLFQSTAPISSYILIFAFLSGITALIFAWKGKWIFYPFVVLLFLALVYGTTELPLTIYFGMGREGYNNYMAIGTRLLFLYISFCITLIVDIVCAVIIIFVRPRNRTAVS